MKTDKELLKEAHKLMEDLLEAIDSYFILKSKGHNLFDELHKSYNKVEEWVDNHDFEG